VTAANNAPEIHSEVSASRSGRWMATVMQRQPYDQLPLPPRAEGVAERVGGILAVVAARGCR
jgi:hypothetical protein